MLTSIAAFASLRLLSRRRFSRSSTDVSSSLTRLRFDFFPRIVVSLSSSGMFSSKLTLARLTCPRAPFIALCGVELFDPALGLPPLPRTPGLK